MRSPPSAAGIFSATFSMPATISDRVPVQARAIALMPEVTPLNNVRNGAMNSCTREAMSSSWVLKLLSQAEVLSIRVPKSTSARRLMKRSTHSEPWTKASDNPLASVSRRPSWSICAMVSPSSFSLFLTWSSAPALAMRLRKSAAVSPRLLTRPVRVLMAFAAAPSELRPISSTSALMTSRPSLPLLARSCSCAAFLPVTLASMSHTGTPRSTSCRISSVCSFCFAQAWPTAVVMPSRRSMPPPSFSDWSSIAFSDPSIGSRP